MTKRLYRQANLQRAPVSQLASEIRTKALTRNWNGNDQQYLYARAMELMHRGSAIQSATNMAISTLRKLAQNYGRTWYNYPSPGEFYNSRSNSNSNSNNRQHRATAARKIQSAYRRYRSAKRASPKRSPYTPRSMRKIPRTNFN
jgi:hypothetical protein